MAIDKGLCVPAKSTRLIKSVILFLSFTFVISVCAAQAQKVVKSDTTKNSNPAKPVIDPTKAQQELNKVGVEPTAIPTVTRTTQSDDYISTPRPHSTGVFGSSFFESASLSFEPNLRIATPANYILGPDDELAVNVSGYQETNIKTSVGPEGTVFIPQVGSISVAGLSIEAATARIKDKMSSTAYPSLKNNLSHLIISLGKIRSIHITAIGAYKPGNFTVSSFTTAYNALLVCGGPGDINTYRNIEVIRNGKLLANVDIYQFLTRGDQKGNVVLRDGDVINFPVYKKHVSINGQVKRTGDFELKDGENLEDLLFFAGGYTDKAYKATITVRQITDLERKIKTLYRADIPNYKPNDGDAFTIDAVLDRIENGVSINGPLYRAGDFELTPGLTVGALVKRAGGLMEGAYTQRGNLTRKHEDGTLDNITFNLADIMSGKAADIPLVKYDAVTLYTSAEFKTPYSVQIEGEVKKPGTVPFKENLSLKDVIFTADGFTDAASAYNVEVSRRIIADRHTKDVDSVATVFTMDIGKGLAIEENKFILKPFDIVTVRKNPGYLEQQRVTIDGEVNFPGTYTIKTKTDRVSDLIKRAGGLTNLADAKGIYLVRNDAGDVGAAAKTQQKEEAIKTIQEGIKDSSNVVTESVAKTNFRIPINLEKVLRDPSSIENYVLLNGDAILVLKTDPLVKISGEVLVTTKTGFVEGKAMSYYLSQAGGTSELSRKSKLYVLYADGHIKRTNNGFFGLFRSYPQVEAGSEVVVPKKLATTPLTVTETVGLTTGIVSTLTLIILSITNLRR